jgi:hypothetical protein
MIVAIRYEAPCRSPTELLMPKSPLTRTEHRDEAERLIALARGFLTLPEEEIVVIYLDHAIETLHIIAERARAGSE